MPKGKGIRHCGKCGKTGHYASTCMGNGRAQKIVERASKALLDRVEKKIDSERGPLFVNGEIAVNKSKYPHLYAALERGKTIIDAHKSKWKEVAQRQAAGEDVSAAIRKLLGIEPKNKMTEEQKQELKDYYEKNKDQILARRKEKREQRKALQAAIARQSEKLTRKRGG